MATTKAKNPTPELKARLLEFHNKKIADSEHVLMEDDKVPCFDYMINVSGGDIMIPDLQAIDKNPDSGKIFKVEAGRRINLNTIFTVGAINRNRSQLLKVFSELRSNLDSDYPAFLLVAKEDIQVEFPFELVKKSVVQKMKDAGKQTLELGQNEYDVKLAEEIAKEKKANEKASVASGVGNMNTRTKQEVENSI